MVIIGGLFFGLVCAFLDDHPFAIVMRYTIGIIPWIGLLVFANLLYTYSHPVAYNDKLLIINILCGMLIINQLVDQCHRYTYTVNYQYVYVFETTWITMAFLSNILLLLINIIVVDDKELVDNICSDNVIII